jgi:competence protein ComEC
LAAGILLGDHLYAEGVQLPLTSGFIFLLAPVAVCRGFRRHTSPWIFGLLACSFFLLSGAYLQYTRLQQTIVDLPSSETLYRVVITGRPEQKENVMLCRARVSERTDAPSVLLYFSPDTASKTIQPGHELLLSTQLALPAHRGTPGERDRRRRLIRQGISGSGFVSAGKWQVVTHHSRRSIQDHAAGCRDNVLRLYRDLGFQADNYAVLSALTVGYKDELSDSVRESFSVSGVSHVLALSGLHIGLLYVLISFLLKRLPGSSAGMSVIRVAMLIVPLWGFAFLTGLSSSVVRSVIMFSLIGLSQFFTGRTISFNTLSVAGMGMLIYHPSWLYDVGFQLSFTAVASILLIGPWLSGRLTVRNRFLNKLWGLATVSIAAQIGTAPLVLLYFSRFSVHFLLTNILVVPLVTVIIYATVVLPALSFLPVAGQMAANGLNLLLDLLNATVRWVERLPFASVDHVWTDRTGVLLFYLMLILLGGYFAQRHRRPRFLLTGLSVLLILSVYGVYQAEANSPRQSLVFYPVRHCPAVHCVLPDGQSWLAYADNAPNGQRLARAVSGYRTRHRLSEPIPVVADYRGECLIRRNNILLFGGKRVCMVNDDRWKNKRAEFRLPVDYLYVCAGYTGRMEDLTDVFLIRQIVLDASIPDHRRKVLQEECKRLNIPYISLSGDLLILNV